MFSLEFFSRGFGANGREPGTFVVMAALAGFFLACAAILAVVNAPFPVLHDMTEAYAWGREFQLGYNQHPPFWAWVCGAWFLAFPRTGWAFAALGALNATIGLGGAWLLIGDFARGSKRWAAFALLLLTPFYTFGGYKYDANTIFLSIWPWMLHLFILSLRTRGLGAAIGFGLCAGLALMSKYYAVILLATCGLGSIPSTHFGRYIRSASPWISAGVAAVICAPHLVWLLTHDAPPLRYFEQVSGKAFNAIAADATSTAIASLGSLLPALAVVSWFAFRTTPVPVVAESDLPRGGAGLLRFARNDGELAIFALAPLALTLAAGLALGTKLTPEMPIGTFPLVPLLFIEALGARGVDRLARASARLGAALMIGLLLVSPYIMLGRAWLWGHANDIAPQPELAIVATQLWREKTSAPLGFVAGHGQENAVVFYSPDRPHSFYDFDFSKNLWVTPERLAELGLMTVCDRQDAACLASTATFLTPSASQIEISVAHRFGRHLARPRAFIVTIVPPRAVQPRSISST